MFVIHTREGHRPDLADCPPAKLTRGGKTFIGTDGPMGRILVRGEKGHDIIPELYPIAGEPVIDKPGKGSFFATDLELILRDRGIRTLFVCGVTTEVCVNTTVREANDRGFECVVLEDCVASYFPEFQAALDMIKAQGAIFGWVSNSTNAIAAYRADEWTLRSCPLVACSHRRVRGVGARGVPRLDRTSPIARAADLLVVHGPASRPHADVGGRRPARAASMGRGRATS